MTDKTEGSVESVDDEAATRALSFKLLDDMVEEFVELQKGVSPGPWERRSFAVGLAGAAGGVLIGVLLPGQFGFWGAAAGLLVEVIGLGLSIALQVKREWPTFRHPKRWFALSLDSDYDSYQTYLEKLASFPIAEREKRLRYIRDRRKVMQHRLGLFSGGLERLGVLPLLAALYLQFRDWKWGDWGMLAEVNLVQGLLIWALLLTYAMGWHLVRLHLRTEAYELLLAEAAHRDAP